jgi:hypothetical protein
MIVVNSDGTPEILLRKIAQTLIAQSTMILKINLEQRSLRSLANPSNEKVPMKAHRMGQTSMDVEMRSGLMKSKADIVRSLKKLMTVETLKVPWLSLLHIEFGRLIERK